MKSPYEAILRGPREELAKSAETVSVDARAVLKDAARRRVRARNKQIFGVATGALAAAAAITLAWPSSRTEAPRAETIVPDSVPSVAASPAAVAKSPPSAPPESTTPPRLAPSPRAPVRATTSARTVPSSVPTETTWKEHWNAGRQQDALDILSNEKLDEAMATSSADEVLAIAQHARSSGRKTLSAAAFELLRRRHAKSDAASVAAIHLGRARASSGDRAGARTMFEAYLHERPRGSLAREARGRLLELAIADGDAVATRRAARAYLAHHPKGPHARRARKSLTEAP